MKTLRPFLAAAAAVLCISGQALAAPRKSNDRIAPSVVITSPIAGDTVHGTVLVGVQTADNVAVKSVTLYLDGYFVDARSFAPYTLTLATDRLNPGTHTLKALATDTSGNRTMSAPVSIAVIPALADDDVQPPMYTQITSPGCWSYVSGVVDVTISAWDNVGVDHVDLYIDGNLPVSVPCASLVCPWDTTGMAPGSYHQLQAIAYDKAGNYGVSPLITVQIAP